MNFHKLYKRGDAWVALTEGRFVVVSFWLGRERIVFDPDLGSSAQAERACVYFTGRLIETDKEVGWIV